MTWYTACFQFLCNTADSWTEQHTAACLVISCCLVETASGDKLHHCAWRLGNIYSNLYRNIDSEELSTQIYPQVTSLLLSLWKERPYRARELGGDLLRLVGHVEFGDVCGRLLLVRRQGAMEHADEGRLPGAILAQHDDDLAVRELAGLHLQLEGALEAYV